LQAEPFEIAAVRSAMSEYRAAHIDFMQVLQDVIATAAAGMSAAGRHALGESSEGERSSGGPAQ
jgi:hypothetical protein